MTTHQEQFLALIRMALSEDKKVPSLLESHKINWQQLYEEACRQGVLGLAYVAVESWILSDIGRKSSFPISPKLLATWYGYAEKIKNGSKRKNEFCSLVSTHFEKLGYKTCILKGQGNAALYGVALSILRNSGDVDVWVYDPLCKTIGESRCSVISYVLEKTPGQCVQFKHIDFPYFKDKEVEVHFMPNGTFNLCSNRWFEKWILAKQDACFNNRISIDEEHIISVPVWEVNVVSQMAHIYEHLLFEGVGIRQIIDFYFLLKSKHTKEQFQEARAVIAKMKMSRFCGALMYVLQYALGLGEEFLLSQADEREGKWFLSEIFQAGNFGSHDERFDLSQKPKNKLGNFLYQTKRNLRFVKRYPNEVMWNPVYRVYQECWRRWYGYRGRN